MSTSSCKYKTNVAMIWERQVSERDVFENMLGERTGCERVMCDKVVCRPVVSDTVVCEGVKCGRDIREGVVLTELYVKESCVKELCVTKLCEKAVCERENGRGRLTGQAVGGRECTREKRKSTAMMWGKTYIMDPGMRQNMAEPLSWAFPLSSAGIAEPRTFSLATSLGC